MQCSSHCQMNISFCHKVLLSFLFEDQLQFPFCVDKNNEHSNCNARNTKIDHGWTKMGTFLNKWKMHGNDIENEPSTTGGEQKPQCQSDMINCSQRALITGSSTPAMKIICVCGQTLWELMMMHPVMKKTHAQIVLLHF